MKNKNLGEILKRLDDLSIELSEAKNDLRALFSVEVKEEPVVEEKKKKRVYTKKRKITYLGLGPACSEDMFKNVKHVVGKLNTVYGMTVKDISDATGVGYPTISKIVNDPETKKIRQRAAEVIMRYASQKGINNNNNYDEL